MSISKQPLSREPRNMGTRQALGAAAPSWARRRRRRRIHNRMVRPVGKRFCDLVGLRQMIRSQDHRRGQEGDPRVPVLLKLSASKRHFLNQKSRTPVDGWVQNSGFDPPEIIRFRRSSHGPGMIGGAESILARTRAKRASGWTPVAGDGRWLAPAKPVLRILDRIDPLAKLAALR